MSTTHRLHLADSSCAYGLPPPKPTAVGRYHFTTQVTSAAAAYRSIRSPIRPHWRPSSRVFRAYDKSVQMGISSHVDRSCKTNEERRASEGECRCPGAWNGGQIQLPLDHADNSQIPSEPASRRGLCGLLRRTPGRSATSVRLSPDRRPLPKFIWIIAACSDAQTFYVAPQVLESILRTVQPALTRQRTSSQSITSRRRTTHWSSRFRSRVCHALRQEPKT
jgi:hypothetical protein